MRYAAERVASLLAVAASVAVGSNSSPMQDTPDACAASALGQLEAVHALLGEAVRRAIYVP